MGPLNLYDMVAKNNEDPEYSEEEKALDPSLRITLIQDSIKIYYG